MDLALTTLALGLPSLPQLLNILIVAVGLGMVIFVHELGHFLVAKWCGVYVERFSIGFGQAILKKKWGETEYVLAWIPFGGYVKMLGQDDMDPSQMTDDQVSENPRSYTAKSVPQRMAIISAGVIMNIITGTMCFILAVYWGIQQPQPRIGNTIPGQPAWEYGIRSGDTITEINGRQIKDFNDVKRRTAFANGEMEIHGQRANGDTYQVRVKPERAKGQILQLIGVIPADGLSLFGPKLKAPAVDPGTAAASAGFESGDRITAVNDAPVSDVWQLQQVLSAKKGEPLQISVARKVAESEKNVTLNVPAERFLDFGMKMNIGKITSLRKGDIADRAGMKLGDQIAKVDDHDVGAELNPMRLTEYFSEHAGQEVKVTVSRAVKDGSQETVTLSMVPVAVDPWSEPPQFSCPPSIPSIGAAFDLLPVVFHVDPDSPADKAGIKKRDEVTRVVFTRPDGDVPADRGREKVEEFKIDAKNNNWAHAFWLMQSGFRTRKVTLTVKGSDGNPRDVEISPQPVDDWYLPTTRGINLETLMFLVQEKELPAAARKGASYAFNSMEDIFLTLRGLFTGGIAASALSGPISIATAAYQFADMGLPDFVLFLGVISINLAVINFLPIPVLDGGHMVFLLWEGIARRKPSEKVVATATYFGLVLVLSLMVFVIFLDLVGRKG